MFGKESKHKHSKSDDDNGKDHCCVIHSKHVSHDANNHLAIQTLASNEKKKEKMKKTKLPMPSV